MEIEIIFQKQKRTLTIKQIKMENLENKTQKGNEIINCLIENNIRLRYFADDMCYLEEKETINEINNICGSIELIEKDEEKDDSNCIETSIVYFKDYDLYIKEVAEGECHYRDVCIDGDLYSLEFILVQPQEKVIIDYVELN